MDTFSSAIKTAGKINTVFLFFKRNWKRTVESVHSRACVQMESAQESLRTVEQQERKGTERQGKEIEWRVWAARRTIAQ